ncbi:MULTISPECIES: TrmB family transcriptional regulator sugar-binding domain-containing protein [Halorubrum]|nr:MULTISPECIES: TrmB family transcriptional regulator sugar-binding domain-containing protein [Halorubrum]
MTGIASIAVDDGDERWTVGGWGAAYEDVEADRIHVTGAAAPTWAELAE